MKKNRMMRLASILLVCVLLTTSVISGTFAKYTSAVSASDTAKVAKWEWAIKFNEKDLDQSAGVQNTFDLFGTSLLMELDAEGNVSDTAETHVSSGKLVAPGTGGKFTVSAVNNSEVSADYTITLKADTTLPIEYSKDNETWVGDITSLTETNSSMTIYWRWAFERGEDGEDTTFGVENTATVKITATVTATQVD